LFRLTQNAFFDELILIGVDELIPIRVDELIPMDVSDLFSPSSWARYINWTHFRRRFFVSLPLKKTNN
jgi:hypothetical protein